MEIKYTSKQSRAATDKRYKQKVITEKKFYCTEHNYTFDSITRLKNHLAGRTHNPKLYKRYHCELCNFHTKIKYDFNRHKQSKKHQRNVAKL